MSGFESAGCRDGCRNPDCECELILSLQRERDSLAAQLSAAVGREREAVELCRELNSAFWEKLSIGSIENVRQGRINTSRWEEIGKKLDEAERLKREAEGA